jgi:hypothetical protein
MRRGHVLCCLAVLAPAPALAQTEAWEPPTLTITRYDEDWSTMGAKHVRGGGWTEPFKHIALSDTDDSDYIVTGIELRARNENYRANELGNAQAPGDSYLWLRAMPYADLHVGIARAFVQPILAYAVGVSPAPGPVDQTRLDMLQAFADVKIPLGSGGASLTLRGGRELLSLGTERLVGTRYGPNVPLAFDGGRAIVQAGSVTANILYVRPVQAGPGTFDDHTSSTKRLWGLYTTRTFDWGAGADLYYLGYSDTRAIFNKGSGVEHRQTVGARFFGKSATGWHWNVEGMYQFGRFADMPISAWSVGSEIGHSFASLRFKPDVLLRMNIVSGDKGAGDKTLGTFNAMFPKGKYFGELSPVGPYNIINTHLGVTGQLGHGVTTSLAAIAYWRQSRGDGIYDIPGNLLRASGDLKSRFIGKQIEGTLAWQATPELELSTSLSAFAPGDFLQQSGTGKTIGMVGTEANFRF